MSLMWKGWYYCQSHWEATAESAAFSSVLYSEGQDDLIPAALTHTHIHYFTDVIFIGLQFKIIIVIDD